MAIGTDRAIRRYVQDLGLSVGERGDGFVVMDLGGRIHELNGSALVILEGCDEPRTAAQVADIVRDAFSLEDDPTELVEACLADLLAEGLVVDADTLEGPDAPQPSTPELEVRVTPGVGRAVFARVAFAEGDVVDRCPVIVVPHDQEAVLGRTVLGRYLFEWEGGGSAVVLGLGSIYNHSPTPNARYRILPRERIWELVALEAIPAGAEVLIDYTGGGQVDLGYRPLPSGGTGTSRDETGELA